MKPSRDPTPDEIAARCRKFQAANMRAVGLTWEPIGELAGACPCGAMISTAEAAAYSGRCEDALSIRRES